MSSKKRRTARNRHNSNAHPDQESRRSRSTSRVYVLGNKDTYADIDQRRRISRDTKPVRDEEKSSSRRHSSYSRRRGHNSRSIPLFLEVLLSWFIMIKSGIVSIISSHKKNRRNKTSEKHRDRERITLINKSTVLLIAAVLTLGLVICALVWFNTNKNSLIVYMNQQEIGIIANKKDITPEYIMMAAKAKLRDELNGTNVEIYDTITTEPIHASEKDRVSQDEVLKRIYTNFNYKIEACEISVDGARMAIVESLAAAETIEQNILQAYYQEGLNIIDASFIENVEKKLIFVNKDELMTSDASYEILTKNLATEEIYTVKSGDMLGTIASENGMTLEELFKLNPDINIDTLLQIGQKLVLSVPKPLLSVKTVERVQYTTIAEKKVLTQQNPNENKAYSKIVQQGKDGQKEVVEDIIRINRIETERILISETITVEPITEIIEIGTR